MADIGLVFPRLPDELTIPSVERRVIRACKTIRAAPDRYMSNLRGGNQPIWREAIDDYMDAYGADEVRTRFVPKPYDVSDCLIALGWCKVLDKKEFRYIWWRSFDNISFGVIAARIGRSDETARRRYNDAIERVWSQAVEEFLAMDNAGSKEVKRS